MSEESYFQGTLYYSFYDTFSPLSLQGLSLSFNFVFLLIICSFSTLPYSFPPFSYKFSHLWFDVLPQYVSVCYVYVHVNECVWSYQINSNVCVVSLYYNSHTVLILVFFFFTTRLLSKWLQQFLLLWVRENPLSLMVWQVWYYTPF